MLQKLLQCIDRLEHAHQVANNAPHSVPGMIEYECGRRIGTVQGIQSARQAIIEFLSDQDEKDNDL